MSQSSRIKEFFQNLNDRGIKVWENFLCCNTCSSDAIFEVDRAPSDMGYCFYHKQDVDLAADKGVLNLKWGAFENDPLAHLIVANAIVDEGKACGLNISWDSDMDHAIVLEGLERSYFDE